MFLHYIKALESQGNEVISVVHPKAEIIEQCPKRNLRTLFNLNQHDFLAIYKLKRLINQEKPDCIITHSYRAAYLVNKTKTTVPKIAVCHVYGHYNFGSNALISVSDALRQDIIQTGIDPKTVFTVPNMIDIPADLAYKEPKFNEIPVIGVCARFVEMKGIDVFLEALALLRQRGVLFKALIAGDGPLRPDYINRIQALNISAETTLLGWVNEKDYFYNSLDIFCLPSRVESFGLVILEGMTHSLPMVLSKLQGPFEIAGSADCAVFTEPNSADALADNLQLLIQDKSLRKKLGVNSFARVHHYSANNVGPMLQNVLMQVKEQHLHKTMV